jgi:hypothetical protein
VPQLFESDGDPQSLTAHARPLLTKWRGAVADDPFAE